MKNITIPNSNPFAKHKLPLFLFLLIAMASVGSGFLTVKLGEEAIKGVVQPVTNPSQKLIDKPALKAGESQPLVTFKPLDITKVTKQVKVYIASQQKDTKVDAKNSANSKNANAKTEKAQSGTATNQSDPAEGDSSAKKN
jgi:hypothetical protein